MLKRALSAGLAAAVLAAPAYAGKAPKGLDALEPSTRMVEVCDMAVSERISKETSYSRVDRMEAAAIVDTVTSGDQVDASGAAFRNDGRWYGLRYSCTLNPDHTAAKALRYAVGREIPESDWEQYGLWR